MKSSGNAYNNHHPKSTGSKALQITAVADTSADNTYSFVDSSTITDPELAELKSQFTQLLQKYNKGKGKLIPEEHMAGISCSSVSFTDFNANDWIVDTGATNHMCANHNLMHNLHSIVYPVSVSFPNGNKLLVTHKGSVALTPNLHIHDVFYVPSFHYDLLSVSKHVSKSNLQMQFSSTGCILQDQH